MRQSEVSRDGAAHTSQGSDYRDRVHCLFQPLSIRSLSLSNRIVMAPMTRCFSMGGVPGPDVAAYYRRRADAGVGLIITEGTYVPHHGASNDPNCPRFHGEDALPGWENVLTVVHAAGAKIIPQLWHVGLMLKPELENLYAKAGEFESRQVGPSGIAGGMGHPMTKVTEPMNQEDIEAVVEAFAKAAGSAHRLGFDGIEIHGAHGYLVDQFLWSVTNLRTDVYGGSIGKRTRLPCDIVKACRDRTAPDFPIAFRISQWKGQDYAAKLATSPTELAEIIEPLTDAGVDLFDCSTRRFWEPEFSGSPLNLAGWAKKISGKPSMTVGSVSLQKELVETLYGESALPESIDRVLDMFERGDFDLVGVGRALLVDPEWTRKIKHGRLHELLPYTPEALKTLA
jgi:2,4-dienoyl-CoA reductase-like NADH-dependent reductase (Old Yellow Enzyme family)